MNTVYLDEYIALVILLIITMLYSISYNRFKSIVAYRIITYYLLCGFIILLITNISAYFKLNNLYLSHFYFWFQFILLSLFYKSVFINKLQNQIVSIVLFVVITILGVQYLIKPEIFVKFNLLEIFLCSFPLIVYSIIHLCNSLTRRGSFMYLNAGVLIYLSSSTLIFIFGNYFMGFKIPIVKDIWTVNSILYIGYLISIFTEWYKKFKRDIIYLKD